MFEIVLAIEGCPSASAAYGLECIQTGYCIRYALSVLPASEELQLRKNSYLGKRTPYSLHVLGNLPVRMAQLRSWADSRLPPEKWLYETELPRVGMTTTWSGHSADSR